MKFKKRHKKISFQTGTDPTPWFVSSGTILSGASDLPPSPGIPARLGYWLPVLYFYSLPMLVGSDPYK